MIIKILNYLHDVENRTCDFFVLTSFKLTSTTIEPNTYFEKY